MGQAPGHLAPGFHALGRDHIGDVVEHQQPVLRAGHGGAARNQRDAVLAGAAVAQGQLKGLLPVLQAMHRLLGQKGLELRLHALPQGLQARHLGQGPSHKSSQGRAQNARGARVARQNPALGIEHHHTGGQVVQDGLQAGAGCVDLAHAGLNR